MSKMFVYIMHTQTCVRKILTFSLADEHSNVRPENEAQRPDGHTV